MELLPQLWKEGEGMSWIDSCDLEYALADFKAENERLQTENAKLRLAGDAE